MYPRHVIEQVLNAVDIVQVVSGFCDLKPAGTDRYKALCPFHPEKTPSFFVSRSKQIFHCFGCGKGGDVIKFLMEIQGLSFLEALESLAEGAGITLPRTASRADSGSSGSIAEERSTLFQINQLSVEFYRKQLSQSLTGKLAQEYLRRRNISSDIQNEFLLGFAPADGESLYRYLRSKGYPEKLIVKTGLVRANAYGERYYDFFRNRIIFPIRNVEGKIVSFAGRELSGDGPKYINLPETVLYQKSKILYGLWEGKESIRSEGYVILVEGYVDLLRCMQCGIRNVVATCGTALTFDQANLLRRFAPRVVIVYDGDESGLSAAIRATGVLLQVGLTVHAVALPENQDPDDYLQTHTVAEWEELIRQAPNFFRFYLERNRDKLSTPRGKVEVLSALFQLISALSESSIKEEFLKEIAVTLGLSYWSVHSDYELFLKNKFVPRVESVHDKNASVTVDDMDFLYGIMTRSELREMARDLFAEVPLPDNLLGRTIHYVINNDALDLRWVEDEEVAQLLQRVCLAEPVTKDLPKLVQERLNRFHYDYLTEQITQVQQAIREAERIKEREKIEELLQFQVELITKRNKLLRV